MPLGPLLESRAMFSFFRKKAPPAPEAVPAAPEPLPAVEAPPVVEVAPGAQGASHIVNTCRNALPPKEL